MQQTPHGTSRLISALVAEGERLYREAVALQVEGKDAQAVWDAWQQVTAALLISSWAAGAVTTVSRAGVTLDPTDIAVTRFALEETHSLRVGGTTVEAAMRFESGPAREVVKRYIRLLPLTRQKWDALIDHAVQAAGEIRADEQGNALERILARSPNLAAIMRPNAAGTAPAASKGKPLPEEVRKRRTPAVQAAVQGSFFVTGLSQRQVEQTQDLLAKVIRQEVTTSVAGKRLEQLGVGDFVEQATLETGTDLTAARLETVYRTNLNRAQSQGQLDICRDETVKVFVPLMQFSATKDKRTRDTHKAMNGFVATVEQIDAMGIPTPLGFNCRCSWNPVPLAVAYGKGWCDEDGKPDYDAIRRHNGARQGLIDKGVVPDVGFISG